MLLRGEERTKRIRPLLSFIAGASVVNQQFHAEICMSVSVYRALNAPLKQGVARDAMLKQ